MLKYYFDVTSLAAPDITGVGVYTKQLFHGLREVGCSLTPVYKASRWSKRKFVEKHLGEEASAFIPFFHGKGLLHGTDFKLLSSSQKLRKVLTIHDLAVFREDLLDLEFCRLGQKKIENELAGKPDIIIVPTEFIRDEFILRYPRWSDKVFAIHHGCDHLKVFSGKESSDTQGKKYFLYVGRLEKRKNIIGLIDAFESFCESGGSVDLLIVGSDGFGANEVKSRAVNSPFSQRISMKGYVSNEELKGFYEGALAFVYPSHYEGFGIPIIEAMKMNVPVLTSNFGAMKEVGGDGALLVDTLDRESFAKALNDLAKDTELREQLRRRGHNRSLEFTWEQTAEKTLEVYHSLDEGN